METKAWALAFLLVILSGCAGGRGALASAPADLASKYFEGVLNYTTESAVLEGPPGPATIAFRADLPAQLWKERAGPWPFGEFYRTSFQVPVRLEIFNIPRNAYYVVEVFQIVDNAISTPRTYYASGPARGPVSLNLDQNSWCAAANLSLLIVVGAEGVNDHLKVRFGVPQDNELPTKTRMVRPTLTGEGPRLSFVEMAGSHRSVAHNVTVNDDRKFTPAPAWSSFLVAQTSGMVKVVAERLRPGLVYSTFSYSGIVETSSVAYRATLDSAHRDHTPPSGTFGSSVGLFGAARTNVSAEAEVATSWGVGGPSLHFNVLTVPLEVETIGLRVVEAFEGVIHSPRLQPPSVTDLVGGCG